jgi:hypothetical protein
MTRAHPKAVLLGALAGLVTAGCLSAWNVSGPWACGDGDHCADGYVCDDGLCCVPGGSPTCPTLPDRGGCASGVAPKTYYRDRDGDGAGDPATGRPFCSAPVKEPWVTGGDDCNDGDATIGPRASERCNAIDDDCDGVVDDGTRTSRWYRDDDHDGYGARCDAGCTLEACAAPPGYADRGGDCRDDDPAIHPGALEACNGVDDNCDDLVDAPPFNDVESPGLDGGARFDCAVPGGNGLCAAGGLQCVGGVKTCVPRSLPQAEQCADGVDNDCDGLVDNPPGCGGPTSLLDPRGVSARAVRLDLGDAGTISGLPARCLANEPGGHAMAWLNPSWVGSSGVGTYARHVWSLEAPTGLEWDLSSSSTALDVALGLYSFVGTGSWGGAAWFANPVVTLCGRKAGEYVRLVPTGAGFTGDFYGRVHPFAPEAAWRVENGPVALDRHRVRSLELVVSPMPAAPPADGGYLTFTLVLQPDAGFR